MRHDRDDHAGRLADGQHVLSKHQVALLASREAPPPAEPLPVLHALARIILAEGRIGNHAVESLQLTALPMERVKERVVLLDIGIGNGMEKHVDLTHGPDGPQSLLAAQAQVAGVASGLLDIFTADDEHAARSAAGVIHSHAGLRLD